jgi:hypothetical protein
MKKINRFRYEKNLPKPASWFIYPVEYTWIRNPIPVTISNINALRGSIRKENGILTVPALIQSKIGIMNDFVSEELSSRNMPILTAKEARTERHPTKPITVLDSMLRPNPLMRKPNSGNKGINQTKFIIIIFYLS